MVLQYQLNQEVRERDLDQENMEYREGVIVTRYRVFR